MQEVPVRVAVRVRPFLPQEKLHLHESCVRVVPKSSQVIVGRDRAFTFDHVLSSKSSQEEVYNVCVASLVRSFFEGYNATVFAYGQTGSGKTYTIGGQDVADRTEDEYGIIRRAVQQMFDIIKERHNVDCSVHVSYIEIYKEELKDLLDLETSSKEMHIREDEHGNTVVIGATEIVCGTMDEVAHCLCVGSAHRHTGATNMNLVSSRSHSILTIALDQRWTDRSCDDDNDDDGQSKDDQPEVDQSEEAETGVAAVHSTSSKFHFVDLAGSERVHKTGNAGERFKESVYINSGLLSLGNVISALSDPKRRLAHVPYRDSKITRILKDSLGGNAKTCMITCISPASASFDETLNALKYANRTRHIKNKPVVNRDVNSGRIAAMQTEIQELKQELQRHQSATTSTRTQVNPVGGDLERVKHLEGEISRLTASHAHYQACTEAASHLITRLRDSEEEEEGSLSQAVRGQLQEWLDLAGRQGGVAGRPTGTEKEDDRSLNLADLQKKLKKARDDLAGDEEIFNAKINENNQLTARLLELEKAHNSALTELEGALTQLRRQEQELVDQQAVIQDLQTRLKGTSVLAVPPHVAPMTGRHQRAKSAVEAVTRSGVRPPSRKLHTSPSLFSLERIVQCFRARSQLILRRLEEQDEVMQWGMSDGSTGSDDTENGRSRTFGATWSKTSHSGSKERIGSKTRSDASAVDVTVTRTSNEIDALRASTLDHQHQVRESTLSVQAAQAKTRDLALNIRLKEELIRELVKTGRDAETVNKQHAQRIHRLEKEANQAKSELQEAQEALQQLTIKEHLDVKDKERLGAEYRRRMEQARAKMKELQRKHQDNERILKLQTQSEKKAVDLELAVGRMKQHQELLQLRLKEEGDRKLKLEKELQKDQQRIGELEIRTEQQQKILRRKTEEVAVAQRKLRQAGDPDGHAKMEEQRKWLDGEADRMLEHKAKVQELEQELSKREEIIAKKEQLLRAKGQLEMKKLRSSQSINKDLKGLSSRIETVEKELEEKNDALRESSETLGKDISAQVKTLKRDRDRLVKQRSVLDGKLGQGDILSPTEERRLIELDEGIDALDAAVDFKNDVIASRQEQLGQRSSEDVLSGRLSSLSPGDVRGLLMKYFDKVVALRETGKTRELAVNELEMKVDEQLRLVRELEGALHRSALESDRRLTELQRQHEQRVQTLLGRETTEGDSTGHSFYEKQISELAKDLYYYKKMSRELRRKLQQVDSGSAPPSGGSNRKAEEEETDTSLTRNGTKDSRSLDTRQAATPVVRKAKKEVRELSAAELSVRRSGTSQTSSVADSVQPPPQLSSGNPWN